MLCPNCGKQIKDGAKFCSACGTEISILLSAQVFNNAQTSKMNGQNTTTKSFKKPNKSIFIVVVVAITVLAISLIAVSIYNQPENKMNREISDGNIDEAYSIYYEELNGEPLSEKTIKKINEYAQSIYDKYAAGEIEYSDAIDKLGQGLSDFANLDDTASNNIDEYIDKISLLHSYNEAISNAEKSFANGDYLIALNYYQKAWEIDSESETAIDGLEKAKSSYRSEVLSQVNEKIKSRDYATAENILKAALKILPDDEEINKKLNGINDEKIQNIVDDAYKSVDGGDWDNAVELLDDANENYPSSQKISTALEDIKSKMPITLKNITTISSSYYDIIKDVVKDRYGNVYDGAVKFSAGTGNDTKVYANYNLNKEFTKFTATAFVGLESHAVENCSISIYLDEKLVYYKDGITVDTAPQNIEFDVTGKSTLKIVVENRWVFGADIYFGNSEFVKVETN